MESILVVCGAGVSSTFLAGRIRDLASSRGLDITAAAVGQEQLAARLPRAAVLLVGPQLADRFPQLQALALSSGVAVALLPATAFGPDGAEAALDLALSRLATSHPIERQSHG